MKLPVNLTAVLSLTPFFPASLHAICACAVRAAFGDIDNSQVHLPRKFHAFSALGAATATTACAGKVPVVLVGVTFLHVPMYAHTS